MEKHTPKPVWLQVKYGHNLSQPVSAVIRKKKNSNSSGLKLVELKLYTKMILKLLVGDENVIRGMPTIDGDGLQRFSVLDFLTITYLYDEQVEIERDEENDKRKKAYANARKCFSRLISEESEHRDEVLSKVVYMKFPGAGQKETPTMTLAGLQRMLLLVGGTFGKKARELLSDTFRRVMAGDLSIIEEVEANTASNSPIQQAYRASLAEEPAIGIPAEGVSEAALINQDHKRKLEELEMKKLGVDIEMQEIENHAKLVREYKSLCPNGELDQAARKRFMTSISNLANKQAFRRLAVAEKQNVRITVEQVVSELGLLLDSSQLSSAKIWASEAKYGERQIRHEHVCTYTTKDRNLLVRAVKSVVYHP